MDKQPQPQPTATPTPAAHEHFFGKWDWVAAALTFLISLSAFVYFMSPSVTLQDSGELVTGAYNFGVPHPPGYPLWAFLGWVWRHIVPIGNPAYRIGLMSAFSGALLTGFLTLLMTRSLLTLLRSSPWADNIEESLKHWIAMTVGVSAALMFALNRGVWLWACVPEMRVMSVLLFITMSFLFFGWMMRPDRYGYLYATVLVYALAIANHQTIAVMALPCIIGALAVGLQLPATSITERMKNLHVFWELLVAALFSATAGFFVLSWLRVDGDYLAGLNPLWLQWKGQLAQWEQIVRSSMAGTPLPPKPPLPGAHQYLIYSCIAGVLGTGVIVLLGQLKWLNWKRALILTGLFLLGASFYFYMPIASSTNPPMNWGYAATKQGFLHAVSRGQYEKVHLANLFGKAFFLQIKLQIGALLNQYNWLVALFGLIPIVALPGLWRQFKPRARSLLVFVLASFLTALFGLLMVINPGLDKQQQEINIKFFAPAHGFYALLIAYGLVLVLGWIIARYKEIPGIAVRILCVGLLVLPILPFRTNRALCDQRNHDFGYQFGYRMFVPGGDYPPMDKDAVLFGGTDPGRFVPTYMIFCESFAKPGDKFADANFDPEGGAKFDRRDVYIITQNALADGTYMSYIRDHYDFSRPDANNPATIADRPDWQRAVFKWAWTALGRNQGYPREPIAIPTERDLQIAFQQYVADVQSRMKRGQPMDPDEQVDIVGGQVQVRGVKGVMNINAILTKWIHDRNKNKHAFYVEESYVIPWMYPYMEPAGIILKINKEPLPGREQDPGLWKKIVSRDTAYWDKLCKDFTGRREFRNDSDAQKTFSKLRSAIGGLYLSRRMYAESIYAFQQAQLLCPDSPEANFRLSQLYMELGRYDDAVATLEAYQLRDPLNDKIRMAVEQLRRLQDAMQRSQQLEAKRAAAPRDLNLLTELVKAYGEIGQFDRVSSICESYLSQTNLPAPDMLQIAQIFLSFRQLDRCMRTLMLITQRHPQDANAYYAMTMLYAAQSMPEPALDALEKAIQIAPNLRDVARNDANARLASLRANPRFQKMVGLANTGFNSLPLFPVQPK
jgi:tetratricopeptide (TPR) repeat protein